LQIIDVVVRASNLPQILEVVKNGIVENGLTFVDVEAADLVQ